MALGEVVQVPVHRHQAHVEAASEVVDAALTVFGDMAQDGLPPFLDSGL